MKNVSIGLPERHIERLGNEANRLQITKSEIIRRMIDERYPENEPERL